MPVNHGGGNHNKYKMIKYIATKKCLTVSYERFKVVYKHYLKF